MKKFRSALPFLPLVLLVTASASPAFAAAGDSDNDGVSDLVDPFPCRADLASMQAIPGENTYSTLLAEDQWPSVGDYDFNDLVVDHNTELYRDAAGRVRTMRLSYYVRAAGALFDNGFAVHLPLTVASTAGVTATRQIGTGSAQSISPVAGETDLVFVVSNNVRQEVFGGTAAQINTSETLGVVGGQLIQITVNFAGTGVVVDGAAAPFDVFLFRAGDFAHQIHRPQFSGTSNMRTSLFNSLDDGSNASRKFVDTRGIPFMLDVPVSSLYPKESVRIETLFPDIVTFGSSAGTQAQNFFNTNIDAARGFVRGLNNQTLAAAPTIPPSSANSTSCLASATSRDGLKLELTLGNTADNGTVSGSTWLDQSGSANHATINGSIQRVIVDGVPAFHMQGSTNSGDMVVNNFYANVWGGDNTHTFETWVYYEGDLSSSPTQIDVFNSGGCDGSCVAYLESGASFDRSGGRGLTHSVIKRAWHHYVVVQNGSNVRTYRDGTLIAERNDWETPTPVARGARIGSRPWANRSQNWFLNRMRFYNRSLSEGEVVANFLAERSIFAANLASAPQLPQTNCRTILAAGQSKGDAFYRIDPDAAGSTEPFDVQCNMSSSGGGWTRVARLNGTSYCGGNPATGVDLQLNAFLSDGKIRDSVVQQIVSGSPSNEVMYFTGEAGRAQFLRSTMSASYRTDVFINQCAWTCADGSVDSTTCAAEQFGCGFSGRGTGGNTKKLYVGFNSGLHSGGGFCGLDNRSRYIADVYVR